ncbi:MAG: T9SS C-terminal target domain-containing protein, partial [Bacteroidetes bacterium]
PCTGSSCSGPIAITSFADSTNIQPGDNFPREFHRGDTINIKGLYGLNPPGLVLDSLWVTHDVYAADWSGLEYMGTPQMVVNRHSGLGTVDGNIDFNYIIPEDAPFFGAFHDSTSGGPVANHIIQVRGFYPPDLGLDVFWNIFIKVVPKETSIQRPELQGLEIFPNPATSFITIQTPGNQEKRVQLFDATGKLVLDKRMSSELLDISGLHAGLYIIRVEEDGKVAGKKIIINR